MQWEYAMDAGSENLRACARARAEVFRESSFVLMRSGRESPAAWGDRARAAYGRCPAGARVESPVRGGAHVNVPLLAKWARRLAADEDKGLFKRNGLLLALSPAVNAETADALERAVIDEGVRAVGLARMDVLCALGAGVNVLSPRGCAVLDAGAEQITFSLLCGARAVRSETLGFGMRRIDERIMDRLRETLGCAVGPVTAQAIKHELARADGSAGEVLTQKPALDYKTMLPRLREIPSGEIAPCVQGVVREIIDLCQRLLRFCPAELAGDLTETGITLTGGGARLFGLDARLREATGLRVTCADEPEDCALRGLKAILDQPQKYESLIFDQMEEARRP